MELVVVEMIHQQLLQILAKAAAAVLQMVVLIMAMALQAEVEL